MVHSDTSSFVRVGGMQLSSEQRHCQQHGSYTAYSHKPGIWSACQQCQRASDVQQRQASMRQQRQAQQAALWQKRLGHAAIPARFAERSLQNYRPTCAAAEQALRTCQAYAQEFDAVLKSGRSLIFCGSVGTGKTHLAVGIARHIMDAGKQAVMSSVLKAVRRIKESYRRDSPHTEAELIQEFVEPDLLILDEVGVQFGSDTEKMLLFDIINGRYEVMKPSILISNLGLAELEHYIGTRAMDRLREGGGKAVVFDWESYRRVV